VARPETLPPGITRRCNQRTRLGDWCSGTRSYAAAGVQRLRRGQGGRLAVVEHQGYNCAERAELWPPSARTPPRKITQSPAALAAGMHPGPATGMMRA